MNKTNKVNLHKIPTGKLREILNDPFTRGTDGADYGPVRHELEAILWEREANEMEEFLHIHAQQQKAIFKLEHNIPSKPKKNIKKA